MEPDENLPKARDESPGEAAAPISSKGFGEQVLDEEALPSEVVEVLKELPPSQRQIISSLVRVSSHTQSSGSSSLIKRITPEHITQTLNNIDKENDRGFKKSQSSEVTKRIGMGAILILVLMVFGYAGVTKDKDLAEKVIIAGISGLGGFGAGVALSKKEP